MSLITKINLNIYLLLCCLSSINHILTTEFVGAYTKICNNFNIFQNEIHISNSIDYY